MTDISDLHLAANEVIRALDEPGADPEDHAEQRAHLHLHWPVLDQRLRDLRVAATFSAAGFTEYGIHIESPGWQFMPPILGDQGVWTTDKAPVEHNLSVLRGNSQFREAKTRLVARRVSPTWEVTE